MNTSVIIIRAVECLVFFYAGLYFLNLGRKPDERYALAREKFTSIFKFMNKDIHYYVMAAVWIIVSVVRLLVLFHDLFGPI